MNSNIMHFELHHGNRGNCFGIAEAKALSRGLATENYHGIGYTSKG